MSPVATFEIEGVAHRSRDLCAYDQFHLLRSVAPILPAVVALDIGTQGFDALQVAEALQGIEPTTITQAFEASAAAAEREIQGTWVPATKSLPIGSMLALVLAVSDANFAAYYALKHPDFRAIPGQMPSFEPVSMPDGESWLFRPSRSSPPMIDMLALYDGRAKIEHVAKANAVLDVEAENDARMRHASERKG